jgi:hypothetical protein
LLYFNGSKVKIEDIGDCMNEAVSLYSKLKDDYRARNPEKTNRQTDTDFDVLYRIIIARTLGFRDQSKTAEQDLNGILAIKVTEVGAQRFRDMATVIEKEQASALADQLVTPEPAVVDLSQAQT